MEANNNEQLVNRKEVEYFDARVIIWEYFLLPDPNLCSLMNYIDTDTLVSWFVDECYVDNLDIEEHDFIMEYYDMHCC